jgi:PAS domain S-box-containing protein
VVNPFHNLTLLQRLVIVCAIPVVVALLVALFSAMSARTIRTQSAAIDREHMELDQRLQELQDAAQETLRATRMIVLRARDAERQRERKALVEAFARGDAIVAELHDRVRAQKARALVAQLAQQRHLVHPIVMQVVTLAEQGQEDRAAIVLRSRLIEPYEDWMGVMHALAIESNRDSLAGMAKIVDDFNRGFLRLIGVLTVAAVLVVGSIGWLVSRSLLRQLGGEPTEAVAAFDRFARGELGHPITLAPGDGHSMMASLERMRQALQRIVHELSAVRDDQPGAQGALGVDAIVQGVSAQRTLMEQANLAASVTRAVLHNAAIGMATTSAAADGRFIKVNQSLARLLGFDGAELEGTSPEALLRPEDHATWRSQVQRVLDHQADSGHFECRLVRRDGTEVPVELAVSLLAEQHGAAPMLILQVLDLTERQVADRAKSEFIAVVSHELRTPLTSVIGSLALLRETARRGGTEGDRVFTLLDAAQRNAGRLLALINDILDIDRIVSGGLQLEFGAHQAATLLQQAIDANRDYAGRHDVHFELVAAPADAALRVDELRMAQVLSNLLSNAAKFSHPGGVVALSASVDEDGCCIRVRDHGVGIPASQQARMFTKFSQADTSVTRRKGGTGLGLFITKQLVEAMGGTIGFTSVVGEGTEFWVRLPLAPAPADAPAPAAQAEAPAEVQA